MPFRSGAILSHSSRFRLFLRGAERLCAERQRGSVRGTITDPSGAVIPGATVHLINAISGLDRTVTTDANWASSSSPTFRSIPTEIGVSAPGLRVAEPEH